MQKEIPQIKSILYITTAIMGTWRYFSWSAYPDIWYSRVQKKVLDILSGSGEFNVSVKFYPNDFMKNPNIEYVKNLSNTTILNDSLLDILKFKDFDLIVTEACATTLLEILCTNSQVVVFAPYDFVKLDLEAKIILNKRVFLNEDDKSYYKTIHDILGSGSKILSRNIDDEFLFKYGIGSPNKDPALLAKNYIESIVNKV